jgi:hypothetical protein
VCSVFYGSINGVNVFEDDGSNSDIFLSFLSLRRQELKDRLRSKATFQMSIDKLHILGQLHVLGKTDH